MKKLEVLKVFRDRDTKKMYKVGDTIDHFDDTRANDAITRELVKEAGTKAEKVKEPVTDIDLTQNWQKTVSQIKDFTDVDKLKQYLETENKSDKPRESITKALNERIKELAG